MTNSECTKEEFYLDINDFQQVDSVNGLYAIARLIQILCILQPGTYPNHPDMGIGIQNFKFEYADSDTIASINSRISEQIGKYLSDPNIISVNTELVLNEYTKKKDKLAVKIDLASSEDFVILFEQSEKTGKVLSTIYI